MTDYGDYIYILRRCQIYLNAFPAHHVPSTLSFLLSPNLPFIVLSLSVSASRAIYSHSPLSAHSGVPIHTGNKVPEMVVMEDRSKITLCAGEPEGVLRGDGNYLYLD